MGKILPIVMMLAGLGAGVGAGFMLRPSAEERPADEKACTGDGAETEGGTHAAASDESKGHGAEGAMTEFVKLNNQFIVPIIRDDRSQALVILSISLEVAAGETKTVFEREPKLRDAFLQILFDHANAGGFDGNFTDAARMDTLRAALLEAAHKALGPRVADVLIVEIGRQDS